MASTADCHGSLLNSSPVIGILCIDIAAKLKASYGEGYHSYMAASYVKYLEAAGGKVIPIWNNRPKSYYEAIMKKINGILMPGGAIFFSKKYCTNNFTNDSFISSRHIFDIATDLNRNGIYFPLWGTCLGFQMLIKHSVQEVEDIRQDCKPIKASMPVEFESDTVLESSKLFAHLPKDVKEKMSQKPFGFHNHQFCITKGDLEQFKIQDKWTVLATNHDGNGLEFISIIEHTKFPFYGSQFHPERIVFENTGPTDPCHHCQSCFDLNQYYAKFFVQQCCQNKNRFSSCVEELQHSVHNFPAIYTARQNLHWQQCFLFPPDVDYPQAEEEVVAAANGVKAVKV